MARMDDGMTGKLKALLGDNQFVEVLRVLSDLSFGIGQNFAVGGSLAIKYRLLEAGCEFSAKEVRQLGDLDVIFTGKLSDISKGILRDFVVVYYNHEYLAVKHIATGIKVDIFTGSRVPVLDQSIEVKLGGVNGLGVHMASLPHMFVVTLDDLRRVLVRRALPVAIKQMVHANVMWGFITNKRRDMLPEVDKIWQTLGVRVHWTHLYGDFKREYELFCDGVDNRPKSRFVEDPFAKPWYVNLGTRVVYGFFLTRAIKHGWVNGW